MKYCIGCRVSSEKAKREGKGLFVGGWCEDCVGKGEGVAAEVGDKRLLGFSMEVDDEVVRRDLERIERLNKRFSVKKYSIKIRYCGCGGEMGKGRRMCDDCRDLSKKKNIERICSHCKRRATNGLNYCEECSSLSRFVCLVCGEPESLINRFRGRYSKYHIDCYKPKMADTLDELRLILPDDKKCSVCGEIKPITNFYMSSMGKGRGYNSYPHCKKCHAGYTLKVKERDREKYLAYQREYQRVYSKTYDRKNPKKGGLDKLFYNPQP